MKKKKNKIKLNLQFKLVASITIFLIAIGGISAYILVSLNTSRAYAKNSSRNILPQTLNYIDLKINIQEIRQELTDISAARKVKTNEDALNIAKEHYEKSIGILNKLLKIKKEKGNEKSIKDLMEVKNSLNRFYQTGGVMARAYSKSETAAGNKLKAEFDLMAEAIKKSIDNLVDKQRKGLEDSFFNISENSLAAQMNMVQGLIGIVLIGIIVLAYLYNIIIIPLRKTVEMFENISEGEGDLSARLEVKSNDELGELADHFNSFVSKIQEIVRDIIGMSGNLAASAEEMSVSTVSFSDHSQNQAASAEEISATIEEISAAIEIIAERAKSQFTGLTGLISNINKLSSSISDMSAIVSDTGQQAGKIHNKATEGQNYLMQINTSMMNIEQSSGEMKNIISMIDDISDKINLLSLNAAIESARAGEAGRGFAVVSEQISKLADQTAKSIDQINSFIKMNSREILTGIEIVGNSIQKLQQIMEEVETINSMVIDIDKNMTEQLDISGMVNKEADRVKIFSDEIKISTEEQKLSTNEIVRSISSINELIQKTASGAEEFAGSTEEMSDLAESLRTKVSMFKV